MTFWRTLKLLAAIHIFVSLVSGYWDSRLSNLLIYHSQMGRVHLIRTLQSHVLLGLIITIVITLWFVFRRTDSLTPQDRSKFISNQIAISVAFFLFLIFFVKAHLVWLSSHFLDFEGLIWNAVILVSCISLFFMIRFASLRVSSKQAASTVFLVLTIGTLADAYFTRKLQLPKQPSNKKTNIILIVVDTLRWDYLSSYGFHHKLTPNLDSLAKEGVIYENAISASPWTTPSHAALFTGQYPTRNGVDGRNIILDPASATLAEELSLIGFQTAGFINNVYIRRQTGLARGFQQYEEFWGRNEGASLMLLLELLHEKYSPRKDTGAAETRNAITDWFRHDWTGKHPFFLFVHLMEPHAPYGVPSDRLHKFLPQGISPEKAEKINQDPELFISGKFPMNEADFKILKALYENDIYYVDKVIGEIVQDLRKKKLLENTLVIFTSDHGEHFGDHNLMSHELSLYDVLLRVPLILRFPDAKHAGLRIKEVVQPIDLFPSVLQYLNSKSAKLDLQGFSLFPDSFHRIDHPYTFAEYDNSRAADKMARRFPDLPVRPLWKRKVLKSVRSEDWKFIWGSDGTRELYSIKTDPYETTNLSSSLPDQVKQMETVLGKWSTSFKPSKFYKQEDISREALEELRSLGYVQ